MFSGLCAFPLTPFRDESVDEPALVALIARLAAAGVDTIGVLGSTGSYPYLMRNERARVLELAVQAAGSCPVIAGIGALRTRDVLQMAEDAQKAGARAVLLAPVSYQPLADDEVYGLYETVTAALSVPLCVYDNPRTTGFRFSDELHVRIAQLPQVRSIKIPALPLDSVQAQERVRRLRDALPSGVSLGISGDASAVTGLSAGCEVWYSVVGGLFPEAALALTRAVEAGDMEDARRQSERLAPLWALFEQHGSVRVVAAAAEILGLASPGSLPLPLRSLGGPARQTLAALLDKLDLR